MWFRTDLRIAPPPRRIGCAGGREAHLFTEKQPFTRTTEWAEDTPDRAIYQRIDMCLAHSIAQGTCMTNTLQKYARGCAILHLQPVYVRLSPRLRASQSSYEESRRLCRSKTRYLCSCTNDLHKWKAICAAAHHSAAPAAHISGTVGSNIRKYTTAYPGSCRFLPPRPPAHRCGRPGWHSTRHSTPFTVSALFRIP